MIRSPKYYFSLVFCSLVFAANTSAQADKNVRLLERKLTNYITYFNSIDTETVKNYIINDKAVGWLLKNAQCFLLKYFQRIVAKCGARHVHFLPGGDHLR